MFKKCRCRVIYYVNWFSVVDNIFMDAFMGGKNAMSEKRPVGRPKGEASTIVNIRVPLSLLARLDRYVDHQEVTMGRSTHRAIVMKNALRMFLDMQGY
jgi:hypothetical protein